MRIYITSRKRTRDSVSHSDFHFALERPIELPEGARGYIDSFVCSNTWETIIENVNARVYCQWSGDVPRILTLDAGPISSTTDLATKLTAGLAALVGGRVACDRPAGPPCAPAALPDPNTDIPPGVMLGGCANRGLRL